LRFILYDLDDQQSVMVLRNMAASMEVGSKKLVMEILIDDIRDLGSRGIVAALDSQIRVTLAKSARERSRAGFEALVRLVPAFSALRWKCDTVSPGIVSHSIQLERVA
jgi:hypothetical protein